MGFLPQAKLIPRSPRGGKATPVGAVTEAFLTQEAAARPPQGLLKEWAEWRPGGEVTAGRALDGGSRAYGLCLCLTSTYLGERGQKKKRGVLWKKSSFLASKGDLTPPRLWLLPCFDLNLLASASRQFQSLPSTRKGVNIITPRMWPTELSRSLLPSLIITSSGRPQLPLWEGESRNYHLESCKKVGARDLKEKILWGSG